MGLGARIEERLTALNISQSELARRAQIPQTTVNSLVKAGRRSTPHLLKLARALQTSPGYLTGETDDPTSDAPEGGLLDAEAQELLAHFGRMTFTDRRTVLQLVKSLAKHAATQPMVDVLDQETGTEGYLKSVPEARKSRDKRTLTETHNDEPGGRLHDKDQSFRGE